VPYGENAKVGKYANVNDIKMYYEIYGKGEPLLLIHGNGGSIKSMRYQINFFSKHYKVIAVDSRAHGKTNIGLGKLTYVKMAQDYANLLNKLQIDSAYVLGWSDGGIIGLLMAINSPKKIKKLAVMGANLQPDSTAVYPWAVKMVKENRAMVNKMIAKKDTSENWQLQKMLLGLLGEQPNIKIDELHNITAPVLVCAGDKDVIREEHTLLIYQNIPKAHLSIFPGETHLIPVTNPELFNRTVYRFFKNPFTRPDTKDFF
jgi:pimeloyl-ACP methyl ester carboxylesterase